VTRIGTARNMFNQCRLANGPMTIEFADGLAPNFSIVYLSHLIILTSF